MSKEAKVKNIENKGAALITGGAKRIGHEIVLNLAKQGYDIAISYHKSEKLAKDLAEEIRENFSVRCEIFSSDLSNIEASQKLASEVISKFSNWNILINNASIFDKSKFLEAEESQLSDNLNIHFTSPLILSKEFAKNVLNKEIQDAQIINMIDKNIARFDTSYFYYLLSKKNLAELTKMLAVELAPQIRVNGIAPGFILNSVHEEDPSDETQKLINKIPLKSKGDVENITQGIDYLLNNNFVTGQILFIDGGASLNHAG